jgi:hypothetical protein
VCPLIEAAIGIREAFILRRILPLCLAGGVLGALVALLPLEQVIVFPLGVLVMTILIFMHMPRPIVLRDTTAWALFLTFVVLFCLYPSCSPASAGIAVD